MHCITSNLESYELDIRKSTRIYGIYTDFTSANVADVRRIVPAEFLPTIEVQLTHQVAAINTIVVLQVYVQLVGEVHTKGCYRQSLDCSNVLYYTVSIFELCLSASCFFSCGLLRNTILITSSQRLISRNLECRYNLSVGIVCPQGELNAYTHYV